MAKAAGIEVEIEERNNSIRLAVGSGRRKRYMLLPTCPQCHHQGHNIMRADENGIQMTCAYCPTQWLWDFLQEYRDSMQAHDDCPSTDDDLV